MTTATQNRQNYQDRINEVKQYIREHIDEPLNREVLAAVADFSVPHFHRIFNAYIGESVAGYVRRVRMERAGRKLRIGAVNITEVALAAGYESHSAFAKAFKKQFGLSPSEFRDLSCNAATQILMRSQAIKPVSKKEGVNSYED
jgi:AraC family transcriptional regulator